MGIDIHGINWIKHALAGLPRQHVLMLGRQSVQLSPTEFRSITGRTMTEADNYAEALLLQIAQAEHVDSLDYSDYEGATIVADLSKPIPESVLAPYDLVIDGGTIEHVFNVNEALANCIRACAKDGFIVHILPANNFNGHGFWQFSAEVFFALYSEANGFDQTEVMFVSLDQKKHWYRARPPQFGRRVHVHSKYPTHLLVKTRKLFSGYREPRILQSDYVAQWEDGGPGRTGKAQGQTKSRALFLRALSRLRRYTLTRSIYDWARHTSQGLNRLNPDLKRIRVSKLVR